MTTKEKIEVMQAFEEGKKIQSKSPYENDVYWRDDEQPDWNWAFSVYRIKPKEEPVRMTNIQLAEWCADNNGQVGHRDSPYIRTYHNYGIGEDDVLVREETLIRPWGSDEWVEPTVDIYERDCKGN